MKTWIKLYTEINRDPDIGTLTWAERGIWSALLALAGEIDDRDDQGKMTGVVGKWREAAWRLRLTEDELEAAIRSFYERGWLEIEMEVITVCSYARRQSPDGRSRSLHAEWRAAVFSRDDYACQECGARGVKLNAHHVRPWFLDEDGRYSVDNGITLCRKCHRKHHGKGWKREAIEDYA